VTDVRNNRGGSQANLAAWDTGLGLASALAIGASTSEWINGTEAEVNELIGGNDYDVLGLAGPLYGLARAAGTVDAPAGQYASASSLSDLANSLAGYQLSSGGYTYNSLTMIPNSDETVQETAYAIMALNQVNHNLYFSNMQLAGIYLRAAQLGNGGWEDYVG